MPGINFHGFMVSPELLLFFLPPSFYSAALHLWMQVFNNLAGSGPDANESR